MAEKTKTFVMYLDDGSKKEFEGTRTEALEAFTDDTSAAFFVEKDEDPGFIWKKNTWCVDKEKK